MKSNGREKNDAKNPAMAEAVKVCDLPLIEVFSASCDLASEKKAS